MSEPLPRLLLVEDDPVGRAFLCATLQRLPLIVDEAANAADAVARAGDATHALALLDLNLPDGDGCALLEALRRLGMRCPAIALSAEPGIVLEGALRQAGFAAALSKPLQGADLHALLARWLPGVSLPVDGAAVPHAVQEPRHDGDRRPAAGAGPTPADSDEPVAVDWDDAAALAAAGGRTDIVAALRGLLRGDLAEQAAAVRSALERNDAVAARAVLHRMQAACGFCGAVRLGAAVGALDADLKAGRDAQQAHARFRAACAQLMAAEPTS